MWQKFIRFWKVFFLTVWAIIKEMKTVRGIVALFISYMFYHGWAMVLVIINLVKGVYWQAGLAGIVIALWAGPFTPLIPLIIVTALLIQRYILFDKSNMINIKEKWIELNEKEKHKDDVDKD